MSIISFIDKVSAQVAVYWGNPHPDGYGGVTYDEPVEINCRWDDLMKVINNADGEELISNAQVLTNADLEVGGALYLGSLSDFDSSFVVELASGQIYPTPVQVGSAVHSVLTMSKIPLVKSATKFVKIYYLKPNWETKI